MRFWHSSRVLPVLVQDCREMTLFCEVGQKPWGRVHMSNAQAKCLDLLVVGMVALGYS
jgi:hypothetical protein